MQYSAFSSFYLIEKRRKSSIAIMLIIKYEIIFNKLLRIISLLFKNIITSIETILYIPNKILEAGEYI